MSVEIKAKKVKRGHTIPGLDNAYVIEVERQDGYLSIPGGSGRYTVAAPEDTILITFNDAQGGEGYLMVDKNHPINVDQAEPQWVGGDW
jgi:hypothetical protein